MDLLIRAAELIQKLAMRAMQMGKSPPDGGGHRPGTFEILGFRSESPRIVGRIHPVLGRRTCILIARQLSNRECLRFSQHRLSFYRF